MSTLSVENLQHPSSSNANITLDSNGNATFAGSVVSNNSLGFRNRIINGDMRIDQRNAGASVTPTNGQYTLDRWVYGSTQASKFTAQQTTTAPVGFKNSLKLTTASAVTIGAGDIFSIDQRVEGLNCSDLGWGTANAKTVTISFWVRSSLTGTFGGSVINGTFSRSYPFSYTIASADTWEQKTITVAGDTTGTWATDNTLGIRLLFSLGSGSTYSGTAGAWAGAGLTSATGATSVVGTNGATFYITGVQLEVGSVATPFERRPYGTELALCQRYYEKSYNQSVVPGTGAIGVNGFATSTANGYNFGSIKFAVTKRADPTVSTWSYNGTAGRVADGNATDLAANSAAVNLPRESGFNLNNASGGTLTFTGNNYFVNWVASSEL